MENNMKTKAVAFIRVSTSRQDTQEQREEVLNMIYEDGYADENIIIIEVKASTIKLDANYMKAIDELEDVVKSGEVNCVYVWALNRLTRKTFIATRFAEVLEKNKVKFKLLNPKMEIFSGNSEFGMAQKILITNMAQVAEMEMVLKQNDFKRTKQAYKKSGRFCGGQVKFGYTLDETKHFKVDEKCAEVIDKIFELYATGKYTIVQIYNHIYEMGWNDVFENKDRPKKLSYNVISDILGDASYAGLESTKTSDKYPAIVSQELFEKVQKLRASKNSKIKRQKHYYFGSKIIKCKKCGSNFTKNNNLYRCWKHDHRMINQGLPYCDSTTSISISVMDGILWEETKQIEYGRLNLNSDVLLKNLNEIKSQIQSKIDVCVSVVDKLNEKEDKIEDIYLANSNKVKYEQRMKDLNADRASNTKRMEQLQIDMSDIQSKIDGMVGNRKYEDVYKRMLELETTDNAEMMNELVHQLIHKVIVEDEDGYKIVKIFPNPIYGNVFSKEVDEQGNTIYYNEDGEIINEEDVIGKMIMVGGHGIYRVKNRRNDGIEYFSSLDNQWHKIEITPAIHHDDENNIELNYKKPLEERMKKYVYSDVTSNDIQRIDEVMSRLNQIKQENGDITMADITQVLKKK